MSGPTVRPVLRAGYGLGLLLTLLPLSEVALGTRPYQPLQLLWRVNTLGQLGTSLMWPLIGAFVLVGSASMLDDDGMLRAFTIITAGVVVLLSGALVVFAHDMMQLGAAARPEEMPPLPFTLPRVALAYGATVWVLSWLAVAAHRVWSRRASALRRGRGSVPLVRGREGRAAVDQATAP